MKNKVDLGNYINVDDDELNFNNDFNFTGDFYTLENPGDNVNFVVY